MTTSGIERILRTRLAHLEALAAYERAQETLQDAREDLGQELYDAWKREEWTLRELGEQLGVTPQAVHLLMHGRARRLRKLADL